MSGSVEHGAQPDTVVQRAYCCKHCGVQCRRPQDLRRHLLVHTDASFSCERCGHKFTRYDTLTRHKRDNCHGYTTDARPTPQQMQQIGSDMSDSGDMASPDAYYASNGGIQQQIQATAEMSVETSPTSRVPSQPHVAPHQPDAGPSQAPQAPTGMPIPPPVAPPAQAHAHAHTHHPPPPQQHAPPPHQQAPQMLPSLPHAPGMASVPQLSPLQGQSNGIAAQMLSFSPPGTQQAGQPVGGVPPPSVQVSQVSSMPVPSAPHMNSVPQVQHVSPPQVPPVPMPPAQLVPPAHMTSGATAYLPQVVPFPSQPSKSSPTDPPVIDSSRGLKPEPWRNNQPMEPNPIGLPPLFQPLRTLRHHSDAELEVQRQRFDSKLTLQISELEDALHKIHSVVGSLDSRMGHIESRLSHLESHLSPSPAASAPPQLQQQLQQQQQQQQQQPQQQQPQPQLQPPPAAPQLANGDAHAPTT